MGLFDIFGGGKKASPITIDPRNAQKTQMDQFLANFVSQYGNQYQPQKNYNQPFTASMSPYEQAGLGTYLSQYLGSPDVSSNLGDVRGMLNKTVNGGFDPGTSQYYQALRDAASYNNQKAIRDTNADLGGRGKFFSTEALQKYGDINAQTSIGLNQTMADLADKERNRSLSAVGPAAGLEQYISGIPLQKATAATTIGALPRQLEQSDLESQYQDFLRKQKEGQGVIGDASGVSNTMTSQGYNNPTLQQGNNGLSSILSMFLGSDAGAGAMSSLGGMLGGAASGIGAAASGAGASLAAFLPMLLGFCWVAAEVFGGWEDPKTVNCRYYIGEMAPEWFRKIYLKHGERFAAKIKNKPAIKAAIRPFFEIMAELGKNEREASYGIA